MDKSFTLKAKFVSQLQKKQDLWLCQNPKNALLYIKPKAKEYFLRKPLPQNFHIVKDSAQGLLVRVSFAFDDELFKLVKTWLPYISIKEPKQMQDKFENILKEYLKEGENGE